MSFKILVTIQSYFTHYRIIAKRAAYNLRDINSTLIKAQSECICHYGWWL